MGLIKAALGAAGGTLADQWKEFFYCDAIDNDVLAVRSEAHIQTFLQYQGKRQHYHHRTPESQSQTDSV